MSKMYHALVDRIIEKVDEIMKKVEHIRDRHISSHDISKELNIDHKTVLNQEKIDYKKNSMFGCYMI